MRKYIKVLLIIAICTVTILISKSVYAAEGITTKETVRLRETASTDSKIVKLISIDEKVEIISQEGEWYKVTYTEDTKNYTGYIRKDMLKVEGVIEENNKTDATEAKETSSNKDSEESTTKENNEQEQTENEKQEELKQEAQQENTNTEENDNFQIIQENNKIKIKNKIDAKILPLINSSTTVTINEGTEITITEILGKWCYIETEQQSGWTLSSKIEPYEENTAKEENENNEVQEEKETEVEKKEEPKNTDTPTKLYVSATTVNLREEANSSSPILEQLSINTEVTFIEKVDNTWSKIKVSGITGYIASNYLSEKKTEITSRGSDTTRASLQDKKEETSKSDTSSNNNTNSDNKNTSDTSSSDKTETTNKDTSNSSSSSEKKSDSSTATGANVVAYAKNFIGTKYVYGGTSPTSGFDCSGFTQYVYKHFGYSISRTSGEQRSNGVAVSKSNLKAGDIVCFSGHVGIYVGNNKFIHAENQANGVKISSLAETYYKNSYITARRIIH